MLGRALVGRFLASLHGLKVGHARKGGPGGQRECRLLAVLGAPEHLHELDPALRGDAIGVVRPGGGLVGDRRVRVQGLVGTQVVQVDRAVAEEVALQRLIRRDLPMRAVRGDGRRGRFGGKGLDGVMNLFRAEGVEAMWETRRTVPNQARNRLKPSRRKRSATRPTLKTTSGSSCCRTLHCSRPKRRRGSTTSEKSSTRFGTCSGPASMSRLRRDRPGGTCPTASRRGRLCINRLSAGSRRARSRTS